MGKDALLLDPGNLGGEWDKELPLIAVNELLTTHTNTHIKKKRKRERSQHDIITVRSRKKEWYRK